MLEHVKKLDASVKYQIRMVVPLGQGGFYSPGSNFSIVDWSLTNAKLHQFSLILSVKNMPSAV